MVKPPPIEVIDLCGDDESPHHLQSVRKRLNCDDTAKIIPADDSSKNKKIKLEEPEDMDDGDKKPAAKPYYHPQDDDDDDVVLLDASTMKNPPLVVTPNNPDPPEPFARSSIANDEEEVIMVGTKNQIRLPHMRQHCTVHPFNQNNSRLTNAKHCDMCYCYVCDVPVKDCPEWSTSHCQACEDGYFGSHYRSMRKEHRHKKQQRTVTPTTQPAVLPVHKATQSSVHQQDIKSTAQQQKDDRRCQHCGCKAAIFFPQHQTRKLSIDPKHFCKNCKLVVSKTLLAYVHTKEYKVKPGVVSLGQKTIPYKLVRPKHCSEYLNDEEALKETNEYLVGTRPNLQRLLDAISPISEEAMQGHRTESRGLILQDLSQVNLLYALHQTNLEFGDAHTPVWQPSAPLFGTISTTFDPITSKGVIIVDLYLRVGTPTKQTVAFTEFLGHWFGVLPLTLAGADLPLKASFGKILKENPLQDRARERLETAATYNNEQVDTTLQSLYTLSSADGVNMRGGICRASPDFGTFINNYFRELMYDYCPSRPSSDNPSNGKAHKHRDIRDAVPVFRCNLGCMLRGFLSPRGYHLSKHLQDNPKEAVSSIDTLMNHLTNRGHEAAPFIAGLTVELLPFQQQSLQWAYERETMPGGIQSNLWPKLPVKGDQNIYFNPILGMARTEEPSLVRGGILAEQMGLGKTVISLALILKNPAPMEPSSGSASTDVSQTPDRDQPFWDPCRSTLTDSEEPTKGSILSRGTLVVCNVSLVGQWVAEAKSKLKDPGLVYSYHGCNRKRDPKMLATNAIVVTTYETLSSDNLYHRYKSNNPNNYVSPCEEIRWWRIICDEGHVLRAGSGKTRAAKNLIGDHKWIVSGTPICTSLFDLKHQLDFLGIEHVNRYMEEFQGTAFHKVTDQKRAQAAKSNSIGPFTFFMRTFLMRHTQSQKYVGTETTLMALPKKTERIACIPFDRIDRVEYKALEAVSRNNYASALEKHDGNVSKHYLVFQQLLTPLRLACAGGPVSLTEESNDGGESVDIRTLNAPHTYKSKLDALIAELTKVRQSDPTAKSLVFSQFKSTLNWLKTELPKHGFTFRTLSGEMSMAARSKALRDFQNDPPTTIFLLSMRAGAVGINLTQANRVFILEPCFNPAVEAQAIGRVHRLGQTRPVEIIRMLMEDSIESRMHKMLKKKYGSDLVGNAAKVGSIVSDKAKVLQHEFDTLLGLSVTLPAAPASTERPWRVPSA